MAGLCLACSIFGLVLVPKKAAPQVVERESHSPATHSFNFAIFRDSSFILVALGRQYIAVKNVTFFSLIFILIGVLLISVSLS
jgi:hypothetical protein